MKEVVATRAGIATLVLMLMGGSIVYGIGKQAGADTWLAVITAVVLSIPFILIYARLVDLSPEHDVLQTMERRLGSPGVGDNLALQLVPLQVMCGRKQHG